MLKEALYRRILCGVNRLGGSGVNRLGDTSAFVNPAGPGGEDQNGWHRHSI